MIRRRRLAAVSLVAAVAAGAAFAQQYGGWSTPEESRNGVPTWDNPSKLKDDVFTFVRIEYDSGYGYRNFGGGYYGGRRRGGWGGGWRTDWPDSDLNFSFRLQQLTSLKVNPNPITLRLTDDQLFDYPFIYLIEPGRLTFSDQEVEALRSYLLRGGFMMVDDFWGDDQWQNFYGEMKRVFPDREPVELDLDHEIFRTVYRLKEKPQVPSIHSAMYGRGRGITWEEFHGGDSRTVHYRSYFDDKGRMMAIICHNTDLGDGWEREGEHEWYFHEFSEKKAYPMGINIVVYAMTH